MGEYTGELKLVKTSVRITETMKEQIEAFEGIDFSSKLRNLMEYSFNKMPTLQQNIHCLQDELYELQEERLQLLHDINRLQLCRDKIQAVINTMDMLQHDFVGEMIDRQHKNIAVMVEKQGFKTTPEVLEQIRRLNQITGKQHNLGDISRAFKEKSYAADQEADKLIKQIYEEFQSQEMERQPIEMEQEV